MTTTTAPEPSGYVVERAGELAVARVREPLSECPDCGGTGLLRTKVRENGRDYDVAAPCPRRKMMDRAACFSAARLPAVHATSTFDTFKPKTDEQDRAKRQTKEFAFRWPQPRGYVLAGPVGAGKTHLLASTLRHLTLELGVECEYVEISLLYATIRRGFQQGKSGGEIIGPLSAVEVLAIDELGKGRGSPFELETLDELIARRYNGGRVTLFATNYSLKPPEERAQRGYSEPALEAGKESRLLCDRVGDRIYSRLCEMCDFIELPPNTTDERRARVAADQARRRSP